MYFTGAWSSPQAHKLTASRYIQVSEERVPRGCSQALLGGAEQKDRRQWADTDAQRSSKWTWGRSSLRCSDQAWNKLTEKLWSLPYWGYSRTPWMQSCATCSRRTCLSREVDPDGRCDPFQPDPFWDTMNSFSTHCKLPWERMNRLVF